MTESALAAEGFGRRYGRRGPWAARDVSLTLPRSSITALVGPNGAGKSTLIRSWLGFEQPDEGRVLVQGVDPRERRSTAVNSIGYVSQTTALYSAWTIDDHFAMVRSYRPTFETRWATHRVESLGLDRGRLVSRLSGGERAQVSLTIALAMRTPILLLDEPMANLDPLARRDFLATLSEAARTSGATVILSSHIVTDVEQACDSLVILSHGRLLLHDKIVTARAEHVAIPVAELNGAEPVSVFSGPTGERVALVRRSAPRGKEASLEEVVLGYLGSARLTPVEAAA